MRTPFSYACVPNPCRRECLTTLAPVAAWACMSRTAPPIRAPSSHDPPRRPLSARRSARGPARRGDRRRHRQSALRPRARGPGCGGDHGASAGQSGGQSRCRQGGGGARPGHIGRLRGPGLPVQGLRPADRRATGHRLEQRRSRARTPAGTPAATHGGLHHALGPHRPARRGARLSPQHLPRRRQRPADSLRPAASRGSRARRFRPARTGARPMRARTRPSSPRPACWTRNATPAPCSTAPSRKR